VGATPAVAFIKAGTPREKCSDAVAQCMRGYDKASVRCKMARVSLSLGRCFTKYPDDINASLFYGLGLPGPQAPAKEGSSNGDTALAISFPFSSSTQQSWRCSLHHPCSGYCGVSCRTLPAARKYATIAPIHHMPSIMPSHILNRLWLLKDSMNQIRLHARGCRCWMRPGRDGNSMNSML